MGISLYLLLKKDWKQKEVKMGLIVFSLQLLLNVVWSFLFFGTGAFPLYKRTKEQADK